MPVGWLKRLATRLELPEYAVELLKRVLNPLTVDYRLMRADAVVGSMHKEPVTVAVDYGVGPMNYDTGISISATVEQYSTG